MTNRTTKTTNTITKWLIPIALFGMILMLSNPAIAQRTVNVAPGFGTLNAAIFGDTLATGERVDSNTVYVLERDGTYILDGTIDHSFPLTIVAAEGSGERPKLIPGVVDGGAGSPPFRPRADLTVKGLYVTNKDELGGILLRQFRVSANDVRLWIEDSHLDEEGQATIRLDGSGTKIYLYNNIISNMGQTSSLANGRVIDDRGNNIDTLIIHNNTIYNITSMVLRNGGSAATINYGEVSQNTIVSVGHQVVDFGLSNTSIFKNNLVVDFNFIGYNPTGENIRDNAVNVTKLAEGSENQVVFMNNNNFVMTQATLDAYPDSIETSPIFSADLLDLLAAAGYDDNNLNEVVTFTNGVGAPVQVVTDFYALASELPPMPQIDGAMDFAYGTAAASYTASTGGQPLGDLRWQGVPVSVTRDHTYLPDNFTLVGNYPNPFNPTTNIVFDLNEPVEVTLDIVNILGQVVDQVQLGAMATGRHIHAYNAVNLSSGIYMIRMQAGNNVQMHKMTLIK